MAFAVSWEGPAGTGSFPEFFNHPFKKPGYNPLPKSGKTGMKDSPGEERGDFHSEKSARKATGRKNG
jgi:hypothetical protein